MSGVRYQKTYVTKPAVADSEVDLPGYMKIEHELQIAQGLGLDEGEVEVHHRWYDLDNSMDRAAGLSSFEFLADAHRGEYLLESYGYARKETSDAVQ